MTEIIGPNATVNLDPDLNAPFGQRLMGVKVHFEEKLLNHESTLYAVADEVAQSVHSLILSEGKARIAHRDLLDSIYRNRVSFTAVAP